MRLTLADRVDYLVAVLVHSTQQNLSFHSTLLYIRHLDDNLPLNLYILLIPPGRRQRCTNNNPLKKAKIFSRAMSFNV